ncbi:unnamed protein product, partial [Durusdinium trenchii]
HRAAPCAPAAPRGAGGAGRVGSKWRLQWAVATVSVDAWRQCHARHRRTFGRVPRRCCNGHTKRSLPPRRLTVISGRQPFLEATVHDLNHLRPQPPADVASSMRTVQADWHADRPPPSAQWMGQDLDMALLHAEQHLRAEYGMCGFE